MYDELTRGDVQKMQEEIVIPPKLAPEGLRRLAQAWEE